MPWQKTDAVERRWEFVRAAQRRRRVSLTELCRRFGISRECGHKWLRRHAREGQGGLQARSCCPHGAQRLRERWQARVRAARQRRPTWGAHKLRWWLQRLHPGEQPPCERTISRWLRTARLTRPRKHRARAGPLVPREVLASAAAPNAVWTMDFKGPVWTQTGRPAAPLTVRDEATSFVLGVRHLRPNEPTVRRYLTRLFRRFGLPHAIRTDNGPPFGGVGALGLTTLTAWCVHLGIAIHFGRPGCPQDNAAHEQMHAVLQKETAHPAAPSLQAQQRRFDRWRKRYNHDRPHAALHDCVPAELYRPSDRPLPRILTPCTYPSDWSDLIPNRKGVAWWLGRQRHFGRAFHGQRLGLHRLSPDSANVYFGPHLLGSIHRSDSAGLRPARWRYLGSGEGGGCAPSLNPPQT